MLGLDPAPRHAGWEEMLKCIRLLVAGGVPDVPTSSLPPAEDPNQAEGKHSPAVPHWGHRQPGHAAVFPAALAHHCSLSPRGEMPPRRSPRGLRVCQHRCQARQWLRAPSRSCMAIGSRLVPQTRPSPNNTPGKGSDSLRGLNPSPPPALGVPASVAPGEGVSGGRDAPAAPTALRQVPFIRWVSKRSESPGGRAAGAPWDWGESETRQPPDSQGCRELPLMFVKPPERRG